ncbi:MAG: helix-turn-helix transcriptional regulator, partial [Blautia sp.]
GFAKFHFSRLLQQYLGTSFSEYRSRQRIQKAKVLLLTTDASITDIAMESGFNSSSTFNRTFYNSENMSPSDFRKFYAKLQN